MIKLSYYPQVENDDPKSEPTFTRDQIIEKMVEMFGDKLANPIHHPRIAEYQFKLAKFELARRQVRK